MKTVPQQLAHEVNWGVTHAWAHGLDLSYAGVDLADVMAYQVMNLLGTHWKMHYQKPVNSEPVNSEQKADDGGSNAATPTE